MLRMRNERRVYLRRQKVPVLLTANLPVDQITITYTVCCSAQQHQVFYHVTSGKKQLSILLQEPPHSFDSLIYLTHSHHTTLPVPPFVILDNSPSSNRFHMYIIFLDKKRCQRVIMEEQVGFVYKRHASSFLSSSKNLPDNIKGALKQRHFKKLITQQHALHLPQIVDEDRK